MKTWKKAVIGMIAVIGSESLLNSSLAQTSREDETVTDDQIIVSSFTEMRYPRMAQVAHVRGIVVIRVKLDDAGFVISSAAVSGPKVLIPDSLANAKKWRFQPNSAKSAVIIYDFRIAEGRCDESQSSSLHGLFIFRQPNVASVTACPEFVQP